MLYCLQTVAQWKPLSQEHLRELEFNVCCEKQQGPPKLAFFFCKRKVTF